MASIAVRALTVLWPAFLMAGVLETFIFALVDPSDLRWFGAEAIGLSRQAIYTLAFLIFWALISAAAATTAWLAAPRH